MSDFPVLPGIYRLLFLYMEPASTIFPFVIIWVYPGSNWFFNQLIPGVEPTYTLDPRTDMAIWQLGSCYFLLGLMSSFVLRAVRDTLQENPAAQERIIGAIFLALGLADITQLVITPLYKGYTRFLEHSIVATFRGLTSDLKFSPLRWNAMTHGNITAVVLLLSMRLAWYLGLGRSRSWRVRQGDRAAKES